MVGSLGALATHQHLLDRLFATKEYNPQGVYGLQLCIYGKWMDVIIDDKLPCYPSNKILFAKVCLFCCQYFINEFVTKKIVGADYLKIFT